MTSRGMEKMTHYTVGVDISKDALDVYRVEDAAGARLAMTSLAFGRCLPGSGEPRRG